MLISRWWPDLCDWLADFSRWLRRVSPPASARELVFGPRVLMIAHRGNRHEAPENTLPAFKSALRYYSDLVELDYCHTSDGVPVVVHDATLDRTTNARREWHRQRQIRISGRTWKEIRTLDAGSWFDPRFAGTMVPSLEEALKLICTESVPLIEHKSGSAEECIAFLTTHNLLDRVVVQSFDWDFLAECRKLAPNLVLAALGSNDLTQNRLDQIQTIGAQIVNWNHFGIYQSDISAIHARDLRVWVYTVNSTNRADQLIREGIDGIVTDAPRLLRKAVYGKVRANANAPNSSNEPVG